MEPSRLGRSFVEASPSKGDRKIVGYSLRLRCLFSMKSPLKLQNQFFSLTLSLTTLLFLFFWFFVTLLHLSVAYLVCFASSLPETLFLQVFSIGLILPFQSLLKVRPSLTLLFNISHSPLPPKNSNISSILFFFPQMSFTTYSIQYLLICFVYCGSPSTH